MDTLQVTVVIPYPGTRLFEEGKEQGFLKTLDWDEYDMRKPVMAELASCALALVGSGVQTGKKDILPYGHMF